jgi:hypothetical protein
MTHPPRVFVGGRLLERIAPGVYSDGRGTMHLAVPELLTAHGWPDTPENRDMVIDVARDLIASVNPNAPFTVIE